MYQNDGNQVECIACTGDLSGTTAGTLINKLLCLLCVLT